MPRKLHPRFNQDIYDFQVLAHQYGYDIERDGIRGKETESVLLDIFKDTGRERKSNSPSGQKPLSWIEEAFRHSGLKEVIGHMHNNTIQKWLRLLGAWWSDDETPWCGTFIAYCLKVSGRSLPKHWYRAKAYLDYGTRLSKPCYGCIAIKERRGGGHVFFVVGQTTNGDIVGLGGNQGNAVNLRRFRRSEIIGYTFPEKANHVKSRPNDERYNLPLYTNSLKKSIHEA